MVFVVFSWRLNPLTEECLVYKANLSKAIGKKSSEQPRLLMQADEATLSLLIVENNGNSNDKNQSNLTDSLTDDKYKQIESVKSEHTRSVLSLSYNQNIHPTSYLDTLINMLKGNIGCGILAMGDAFKNGGLLFATIFTIVISLISAYNQHTLLGCSKTVKKKLKLQHNPKFAETIELSFQYGPQKFQSYSVFFRKSVNSFIVISQLGLCCVYVIFISKSLQQVMSWYNTHVDVHLSILITMVPVLISSLIRNLKFIARLSALANVCMFVGIFVILYYCTIDLPPITSRTPVAHWTTLPLFFGTSIFAFEGISLVLPLQQEMKSPKQFTSTFGVLNVGTVIVTTLLLITGFMGYLKFGEAVRGSLTLNLQEEFLLSKVVISSMMLNILCSYSLQFYVSIEVLWPIIENKFGPFRSPLLWEIGLRVILVLITFIGADVIPHLTMFISLIGAVACSFLALIFPPLCHIAVVNAGDRGDNKYGLFKWQLVMDALTLAFGTIGFFTGTYASVYEIYGAFRGVTIVTNSSDSTTQASFLS
ncbi:proton-coupled amino acid transporter-like protein CG1139 isoform X2 [Sipha flava]|uniref:Proton-coupled amino acid transporter-like protein CG1139 isoform X2 n=1 Tax=Sipha flava TaxID=143950 RepID=A0A8B8GDF9_9HEMI|nr:proton-coupled amino acid transporter-like protein CG1139 isoform X2 [Sipha flava]